MNAYQNVSWSNAPQTSHAKRNTAQALSATKQQGEHPLSNPRRPSLQIGPSLTRGDTLRTGHHPPLLFPKHTTVDGRQTTDFQFSCKHKLYTSCSYIKRVETASTSSMPRTSCNPLTHYLPDLLPFRVSPHYQRRAGRYVDPILGFCILNREAEAAVLRASLEGRLSGRHCDGRFRSKLIARHGWMKSGRHVQTLCKRVEGVMAIQVSATMLLAKVGRSNIG